MQNVTAESWHSYKIDNEGSTDFVWVSGSIEMKMLD